MNNQKIETTSVQQIMEISPMPAFSVRSKDTNASAANICPTCDKLNHSPFRPKKSKTFERLYNLKVHLRKHTGETPYDCPIRNCAKQFKWRSSMAHHVRAHHTSSELTKSDLPLNSMKNGSSRTLSSTFSMKKKRKQKKTLEGSNRTTMIPGIEKSIEKRSSQIFVEPSERNRSTTLPLLDSCQDDDNSSMGARFQQQTVAILSSQGLIEEPFFAFDDECKKILETLDGSTSHKTGSLCLGTVTVMESELSHDATDHSLSFLAPGSEDATDAEMETLAQIGGQLSSPESIPSSCQPLDATLT